MERLLKSLENFFQNKLQQLYHTEEPMLEAKTYKEFVISNLDIYIENQPVFKNPIMKTISIGIFTFFTLKKVILPNIINSFTFADSKILSEFIKTWSPIKSLDVG